MRLMTSLDHVNLLIDSGDDALVRARAFYQKLLGLEPLERPANTGSGNPGAWYQCGVQQTASDHREGRVGGQQEVAPPPRLPRRQS
jgi:catechol 2,3-dioxygenase-like lactoylglutathione lyase family enzyme